MDFYSLEFFAFSAFIIALFFLLPLRFRWIILLIGSYFFYSTFKREYLGIIAFSTLATYLTALAMEKSPDKRQK